MSKSKKACGSRRPAIGVGEGRCRVVIEHVKPEVDGGRYAIERTVGESVTVEADMFADGHDLLAGVLRYRHETESEWSETPLEPLVNDRWRAQFLVTKLGRYRYTIQGWMDPFRSWLRDLKKKVEANQDVSVDLLIGAQIIEAAAARADGDDAKLLRERAAVIKGTTDLAERAKLALSDDLVAAMDRHPNRTYAGTYAHELIVEVERERARFSAWYEMFPRSCSPVPGRHGTFKDCEARLPYVAEMGFDILYLPPIHPIGRTFRKGKNNALVAGPDDVGSPWAIGSEEGGHKAIHPQLGTLEDFRHLVGAARKLGIEIALDIAFQCSADHPYVKEHPEWFRRRPDGTVQYAENPPKKYQDIYPFDFETENWRELWMELKSIFEFWMGQGINIFRVDNPHTKPFAFWEWLIGELKQRNPEVILLSEAFTRPKVLYKLAKLGFTQSYNYFPWRNTKWELTQYLTELTQSEVREFCRASLWTNTPDILTEYLQFGGRPAFIVRLVLAATLGASYGIYGPAFELCERQPREPRSEEYLNSEKYELKHWELSRPDSLAPIIARVNRIRRESRALQFDHNLRFHGVDNEELICYTKHTPDQSEIILVVVNLDPHHKQSGWVSLPVQELSIDPGKPYQVHDLLNSARYVWHGSRNYVELDPQIMPAHIFRVRRLVRSEKDFDHYL
ncbi:MAG: alpha-1,4-glucan--maltose-1-phosphate maltosyltransferase [Verrucomicrobiae bacterium]|nr:alpha-1,4-glucan--maltose-1-phosphate maltosyltransferase [Verrucomicrobiae bacterium]